MKIVLLAPLIALTSACTWVTLNEHAKSVTVVTESHIANCQKLGNITAKTRAYFLDGADRDADKVALELTTLARNEALKLNSNTIVPTTDVIKGEQSFHAYYCVK